MSAPGAIRPTNDAGDAVLRFWFEEAKPSQWFFRDPAFDRRCRKRFAALHAGAGAGALDVWRAHPRYALALILLLDQLSRNIYRDQPQAFAFDARALAIARDVVRRRFDLCADDQRQAFFYMPFMHAEDLAAQKECVALFKSRLPHTGNLPFAIEHREIIARFGRFPHRNRLLGRQSTPAETAYLKSGGFNP